MLFHKLAWSNVCCFLHLNSGFKMAELEILWRKEKSPRESAWKASCEFRVLESWWDCGWLSLSQRAFSGCFKWGCYFFPFQQPKLFCVYSNPSSSWKNSHNCCLGEWVPCEVALRLAHTGFQLFVQSSDRFLLVYVTPGITASCGLWLLQQAAPVCSSSSLLSDFRPFEIGSW